jgi:hypothetical protein
MYMQPVERNKEETMSTIKARHAPLEVILLDSEDDESTDQSEEEREYLVEDSSDSVGTKIKYFTKKQSPIKKMSKELMEQSKRKEQQRRENEKRYREERMRNEDKEKRIFEEAKREKKSDQRKRKNDYAQTLFKDQETQKRKRKGEKKMKDEAESKTKRKEERQKAEEKIRKKEQMVEAEQRKKAQENTRRLVEEVKIRKIEEESRRAQETRNRYKMLQKQMSRDISKEQIQLEHEAKLIKAMNEKNNRWEESKKRKAEEAAMQKEAGVDESEKRKRVESSFICSTCHSALPDKNSFQIHLFGQHGHLWCEMCSFVGNIVTMTSHLLDVHGQVNHPSYSLMVEWNAQYNQESDSNCMGSPLINLPSPTTSSSLSLGFGSMSPVKINMNPKSMLSISDRDLVQCQHCPFKTDNLVELNHHEKEGHRQDQHQVTQPPAHAWVCPYCLVQVDTGPLLKGHIKECPDRKKEEGGESVEPQARYICPYCDIICVGKEILKIHLFIRIKFNLKCIEKHCTFVACTTRVHTEHMKQNHWQCLQCNFNTTLQSSFGAHFMAEHSKKTEHLYLTDMLNNKGPSKKFELSEKLVTQKSQLPQPSTQLADVNQMPIIVSLTSLQPKDAAQHPPSQSAPPKSVMYARKQQEGCGYSNDDISSNPLVTGSYVCPHCNKVYCSKGSLSTHVSANHSKYGGGKKCQFCGKKQLDPKRHKNTCRMRSVK